VTNLLKKPEEIAFAFASGHIAIAQAGRYQLEDQRPWNPDYVPTAVIPEVTRPIRLIIPAKDGSKVTVVKQTHCAVHWTTQYNQERGKLPAREQGKWYESHKLEGPDPP
jgi:hypothetical protein